MLLTSTSSVEAQAEAWHQIPGAVAFPGHRVLNFYTTSAAAWEGRRAIWKRQKVGEITHPTNELS
jgi:hypothetical protein